MNDQLATLRQQLTAIRDEALDFFSRVEAAFPPPPDHIFISPTPIWESLSPEEQAQGMELGHRLRQIMAQISSLVRSSPLVGEADLQDLRHHAKDMAAAVRFRRYKHRGVYVHHDEGIVLGVDPPAQWEEELIAADEARPCFADAYQGTLDVMDLVSSKSADSGAVIELRSQQTVLSYRKNTAFIMMWISREHPELDDVRDTVREVFKSFGVTAVRADEIEHEGVITDRIMQEITNSEFLFADLTGERPSVYYEIGYAHALGKRVMLFRKKGTEIHFDLAYRNCPEYENLADLRKKLQQRLSAVTNKET